MVKYLMGGQPQPPKTSHCLSKNPPGVPRSLTTRVPPSSKQCMQRKKKAEKGAETCFSNFPAEQKLRIWAFQ